MKKLVKTAKQQFEERLSNFINPIKEVCHYSTYYLCTDEQGFCVILYSYNEGDANVYKEFSFGKKLDDIYTDEDFLCFIVDYWSEYINTPIKELFEWYASADRENAPFSIDIILQFAKVCDKTIFEDLYEEVPDVRIITADEQFECRLEEFGLLQAWNDQGCIGRIGIVEANTNKVIIFVHEDKHDAYTEFVYPPFEELRKDSKFCLELLGELVDNCDDLFFKSVSRWIHFGGNCPLDPVDVYFSANHLRLKETVDFEDKEFLQEQSITKKDFSTEITDLKERMIKHIEELHKQGMTLDSDSFLENAYSITWSDGSYYACENLISCKLTKSDEGVLCFSEIQVNDKDVTYDSPLSMLTINTLWSIIDAMR